tara:strand:+ start:656 stop:820 length:165 start_codon:yes stop_codon:yes gene_type:complete
VIGRRDNTKQDYDTTYVLQSLLGEYDLSGGFRDHIYVDSKTAAKAVDDATAVGQ